MTVIGVDYSLRRTAACALPLDFAGELRRAEMLVLEGDEYNLEKASNASDRMMRASAIALALLAFIRPRHPRVVVFESYAYSAVETNKLHVAEACGVARIEIVRSGIAIDEIPASKARKLLLGANPSNHPSSRAKRKREGKPERVDAKKIVERVLKIAGAPKWGGSDEYDALLLANAGVSELGYPALASLPAEQPKRNR